MSQSILTNLQDGARAVLVDAVLDVVSLALEILQDHDRQDDLTARLERFREEASRLPELSVLIKLDNQMLLRRFLLEGRLLI